MLVDGGLGELRGHQERTKSTMKFTREDRQGLREPPGSQEAPIVRGFLILWIRRQNKKKKRLAH